MTDFPHVAPPELGLQRAMAEARGRRLRTAGLSTSAVASAVAVLAMTLGGGGTQSLVQQPAPEQPAVSHLVPGPATPAPAPVPNAVQAPPAVLPAGARATVPRREVTPAPGSTPLRPTGQGRVPRRVTGPMSRTSAGSIYPDGCPLERTTAGQVNVCPFGAASSHYDDRTQAAVPGVFDLFLDVCSYDTRDVRLHFLTTAEADMAVLDSKGHELWRWSAEHPARPDEHALEPLSTGTCWQWTTTWASTDQQGHRLAPGTYTLRLVGFARELGDRRGYESTITVS